MMEIFSKVNVMPVNFSIRPVKMNDVQGIQRVAQLTWNHTYGTIYTDDFINSFLEQAYSNNSIEATISRDEKREIRKFMVAESESGIIGYAQLTVTKDGEAELLRMYVLPAFQGSGIGKAFLRNLIETDNTLTRVFAWVEKENKTGTFFYQSNGFLFEEDKEEATDGQVIRLNKYVKQVK
jgi:N-acetylglutamate synthase-like GNAT family acetyltransferase